MGETMSKALEAAAGVIERGTVIASNDCKTLAEMVITAFLDAAAGDLAIAAVVGYRANDGGRDCSIDSLGKAAILALKEAVNG
jgi:hypothetical protein